MTLDEALGANESSLHTTEAYKISVGDYVKFRDHWQIRIVTDALNIGKKPTSSEYLHIDFTRFYRVKKVVYHPRENTDPRMEVPKSRQPKSHPEHKPIEDYPEVCFLIEGCGEDFFSQLWISSYRKPTAREQQKYSGGLLSKLIRK